MEQTAIFILGAAGYSVIEIIWRGYTHWTMTLTGGICLLVIYFFCKGNMELPLVYKSFIGSMIITLIELAVGIIVNIFLKWNVWDYSGQAFNFLGQICLKYSLLWFLLCTVMIKFFDYLQTGINA